MLATDHADVLANNPINLNDDIVLMKETDFARKNLRKRTRHRPL